MKSAKSVGGKATAVIGWIVLMFIALIVAVVFHFTVLSPILTLNFNMTLFGELERGLVAHRNALGADIYAVDLTSIVERAIPIGTPVSEAIATLEASGFRTSVAPPWTQGAGESILGGKVLGWRASTIGLGFLVQHHHHVELELSENKVSRVSASIETNAI